MNILRRLINSRQLPQTPGASSPAPTSSTASPTDPPAMPPLEEREEIDSEVLREALFAFLQQETMADKRAMLHRTPLLLTPAAVIMCNEIAQARQENQSLLVEVMPFLATVLADAQERGIDPVMDEWEDEVRNDVSIPLIQPWLKTPTHREERHFLQAHPEMLTDSVEGSLQMALELLIQNEQHTLQQQKMTLEAFPQRLYMFRDIRARIAHLRESEQFPDEDSLTKQAILEGYINWQGGFMHDLPAWLEKTIQKSQALRRKSEHLSQTASSRATLWQKALKRAQREGLAAEIVAEIAQRIWDALDDIAFNQSAAQEAALQYLDSCLQVYTEERYPYQWATIQNELASTYNERIKGEKADNLEQAISVLTASLHVCTRDVLPFEWARTQNNLGHVYWNRIKGEKADNLEQAIIHCSAALQVLTEDVLPFEWARVQNGLGAIYLSRIRGNIADNLEQSIACFTAALHVLTEDAFPSEWAATQNNLGNVYWNRIKGEKADNLEQAIIHCSAALRVQTEKTLPLDWATTQNGLGAAYLNRIKRERADNLEQAIACFTAALRILTEENSPSLWAVTQNNLGAAYGERIEGDKADNLEKAITCFITALHVYTETTFPFEWAKTQQNMGRVYISRIKGDKADNLEDAIACFFAALQVYTKDAFPVLWAIAQNNLGLAYNDRIKGDVTENLEDAIACFFAVSRVYTRNDFPFEWARTQSNLGVIYSNRIRGDKADNLEQAITVLTSALDIYTEDALPLSWAITQINLSSAYSNRIRGDKANNLEQAIICGTAALRVLTKEALPFEWAILQNNLGALYSDRIKGDKAENLEQAMAHHRAALSILTKEAFPFDWARTRLNLGFVYNERIEGDKADNSEQAIACYRAALDVYTEDTLPLYHRVTKLNYAELLANQSRLDEAHSTYLSALSVEKMLYTLAGNAKEQDAILVGGRDGAIRDTYALVRLGRLGEAAVTLEQGRARGLAAARMLDAADPQRITDPIRRADYLAKRDALRQSSTALQQPEEGLLTKDSLTQSIETRNAHAEQNTRYLAHTRRFRQDQAAFQAALEAIRVAGDPVDFLEDHVTEATLLEVVQRGPASHAIVSLFATPWGGMALGAFSAHPDHRATAQFASLDLPTLTDDAVTKLIWQSLDSKVLGGLLLASERSIIAILQDDWAERQRPSWDGTTPLQEWEQLDAVRRQEALDSATFKDMAGWLHEGCHQQNIISMLDVACQEVLQKAVFHFTVSLPWRSLKKEQQARLQEAVKHTFLLHEIEHVLATLSDWIMQPLAAWMREEGVTTVTLIPCGYLAALPILACEIGDGKTFAEAFHASVAPSLRSLVSGERTSHPRSGVATLGNPFPTHQSLHYGQAEALTLASLGGNPERCRIQTEATKAWLVRCLQEAQVVDASCHGVARYDYLQSALYLADDTLSLGEALNHQVVDLSGLRLLILSACQTAIPDVRGAENEVRSLAVGMVQAGAQAVMASLWSAHDRATYILVVRFAQEWFPHMHAEPPAVALARAQRWLRHVTWEELTRWQANEPLQSILATMPASQPKVQSELRSDAREPAKIQDCQYDLLTAADRHSDDTILTRSDRTLIDVDQQNVSNSATSQTKKDPQHRPYTHPFYWAGFQITGW